MAKETSVKSVPAKAPRTDSADAFFDDLLGTELGKAVMKAAIDRVVTRYFERTNFRLGDIEDKLTRFEADLRDKQKRFHELAPTKCDLCEHVKDLIRDKYSSAWDD